VWLNQFNKRLARFPRFRPQGGGRHIMARGLEEENRPCLYATSNFREAGAGPSGNSHSGGRPEFPSLDKADGKAGPDTSWIGVRIRSGERADCPGADLLDVGKATPAPPNPHPPERPPPKRQLVTPRP